MKFWFPQATIISILTFYQVLSTNVAAMRRAMMERHVRKMSMNVTRHRHLTLALVTTQRERIHICAITVTRAKIAQKKRACARAIPTFVETEVSKSKTLVYLQLSKPK